MTTITPSHCGKFHFISEPLTTVDTCCPVANTMYFPSRTLTLAFTVECTVMHTVLHSTPNKWPMLQYSEGAAKNHKVIATLSDCFQYYGVLARTQLAAEV